MLTELELEEGVPPGSGARTHQCPCIPLVGTPLERRERVGVCPGSGCVCACVSELHRGCFFRSTLSPTREKGAKGQPRAGAQTVQRAGPLGPLALHPQG